MTFVWALILVTLSLTSTDATQAQTQLDEIKAQFSARPRKESEAALQSLAKRLPQTEAAERARLWLGSLALADKSNRDRLDHAAAWFAEAQRHNPTDELLTLAERGEGDVALAHRRWREAAQHYDVALRTASEVVAIELNAKRRVALREHVRDYIELVCWIIFALTLGLLCRSFFGVARAWPHEVTYVAPVYALLIAVAAFRDRQVALAIGGIAAGSLVLLGVAFAPTKRGPLRAVLVVIGTVAVFYIALRRAELLDLMWATITHQ